MNLATLRTDRLANLAFNRRLWRKQQDAGTARKLSRRFTFLPPGLVGPVREYDACCQSMRMADAAYREVERADTEHTRRYPGAGCMDCGCVEDCADWCASAGIREEYDEAVKRIDAARKRIGLLWDSSELARVLAESEADDLADRDDSYPAEAICVSTEVRREEAAE